MSRLIGRQRSIGPEENKKLPASIRGRAIRHGQAFTNGRTLWVLAGDYLGVGCSTGLAEFDERIRGDKHYLAVSLFDLEKVHNPAKMGLAKELFHPFK